MREGDEEAMKTLAAEAKFRLWRVGRVARPVLSEPELALSVTVATVFLPWMLRGPEDPPDKAVTQWRSMRETELERNAYARRGEMSEEENDRRLYEELTALELEAEDRHRRNVYPYNHGERWRSTLRLQRRLKEWREEDRRRRPEPDPREGD